MSAADQLAKNRLAFAPITQRPPKVSALALPEIPRDWLEALEVRVSSTLVTEVTPEDVRDRISRLVSEHAKVEVRAIGDRVETGDEVLVDLLARQGDQIVPGSFRRDLVLSVHSEELLPDLIAKLSGRAVGERLVFDVPLGSPFEYGFGRRPTIRFFVHIRGARRIHVPEIDDGLLARLGRGGSFEALYESVERELVEERSFELACMVRNLALDRAASRIPISVPQALIDLELRTSWLSAEGKAMAELGLPFRDQEASLGVWMKDPALRRDAERCARIALMLGAFAKAEGIRVEEADLESALRSMAEQGRGASADKLDKSTRDLLADKLLHLKCLEILMSRVSVRVVADSGSEAEPLDPHELSPFFRRARASAPMPSR
jgi:FKBP-type peptidyl-prolyl cis-trans isomerase (trigger factor)